MVMPYLTSSKLAKTIAGQKELVELVAERAEIDRDFDLHEEGTSDRIIMCVECVLPLFNVSTFFLSTENEKCMLILSIFSLITGFELNLKVL